MIPLRLEFQAFGSYVKRQTVDFTQFHDSGIFLINGKTGSGKTTIIDAMVFALYGSGSGDDRNSLEQMRSFAFGAENIPSEIEYTFEAKGETYKFTRSCRTRTVKKRSGVQEKVTETDQNAFRLAEGVFVPVFENPKISDVNGLACELVGLNREQFTKVMVLPQGKFESFLVADSKEKEEILCTLFNVSVWKEISEWLVAQSLEMLNKSKEHSIVCQGILKSWECENGDGLADRLSELVERLESLEKQRLSKEEERQHLEKEREEMLLVSKDFEELFKVRQRLVQLEKKQPEFERLRAEIEKNRLALVIKPYYEFCQSSFSAFKERKKAAALAKDDFDSCKRSLGEAEKRLGEALHSDRLLAEKSDLLKKMYDSREGFERLSLLRNESDRLSEEIRRLRTEEEKNKQKIAAKKKELSKLEEEHSFAARQLSGLSELASLKAQADEFLKLSRSSSELDRELLQVSKSIEKNTEQQKAASEEYEIKKAERDKKFHAYIKNIAGNLAAHLEEGKSCPVCGSVHHPIPARQDKNSVTPQEINALDNCLNGMRQGISKLEAEGLSLEKEHKQLAARLEENNKRLGEMREFSEEKISQLDIEYNASKTAGERLGVISERIKKVKKELEQTEGEALRISEKAFENEKLSVENKAEIQGLVAKTDKILSDVKTLQELEEKISKQESEIHRLTKEKEQAQKIFDDAREKLIKAENTMHTAENEQTKAEQSYNQSVRDYTEKMGEMGFGSREEFVPFLTSQEEIDSKQKSLDDYAAQVKSASESCDLLSQKTKGRENPDVSKADEKITQTKSEIEKIIGEKSSVEEKCRNLNKAVKDFTANQAEFEALSDQGRRLSAFGKDLRGDNSIGLRRFVIGVMLEKVIFEANNILKEIKGGQFRLVVNREKQGASRRFGLDLFVESTKTDRPYSVKYLSGGEKFLVAMALSMALSSIVQMYAGGIKIDALFIDEGFGALDPAALDEAMQVLSSVSGSRKVMGIISHVEALKDAIPKKINVTADSEGSHLTIQNS